MNSLDDKGKVNVVQTAVSRFVTNTKFYNFIQKKTFDHDFPIATRMKIIPSGYLEMELSSATFIDEVN